MRVIAGKAKGHHLKFPKGTTTRPATDLVRGAIFGILENMADDWSEVLDVFSGSGALGIEALSRGAGHVDFVDREPRCCGIIKENLQKTNFADQADVHCREAAKALPLFDKEYNIILMDPPYADKSIHDLLAQLAGTSLVGASSTVVVTHSPHQPLNEDYASLKLVKEHRHGDSCICIYRREVEP